MYAGALDRLRHLQQATHAMAHGLHLAEESQVGHEGLSLTTQPLCPRAWDAVQGPAEIPN